MTLRGRRTVRPTKWCGGARPGWPTCLGGAVLRCSSGQTPTSCSAGQGRPRLLRRRQEVLWAQAVGVAGEGVGCPGACSRRRGQRAARSLPGA
eukprot:350404-Chlamydomonas_euryale.AAC.6